MKFKRFFSLFLVFILLFASVGCKAKNGDASGSEEKDNSSNSNLKDYLTLLYSSSDTFNPYTAKTAINRQICQLIYEPLFRIDNNFSAQNVIALNVSNEGKQCVVDIKNYTFSDGSPVRVDDIVYSFNLAKSSASSFAPQLYQVSSAAAVDSDTVVFHLNSIDKFAHNLLDFPIIKAGTENLTNSDSVVLPPVGCGKFMVNETLDGLVLNPYSSIKNSNITYIKLINSPDIESISHYAQIGASDMYYSDISDGNILRMTGKKQSINLNCLLYLGFNRNIASLNSAAVRQAFSSGIDREKIAKNAYFNNAVSANGFFNPAFAPTNAVQNIQNNANIEISVENLEKIGYNILDNMGFRKNNFGTPLKFTLLVNSENRLKATAAQLIASQLSECGIQITVVEKDYQNYLADLQNGNFQLYIGEVKLTNNMDISSLLVDGGSAAYGLPTLQDNLENAEQEPNNSAIVIKGFYSGTNSITDVATVLQNEMPLVPILYRTGVLFYNDNIEINTTCSAGDVYNSIESYIYKDN